MAARRTIAAINWGALAERVPETQKSNFAAFKAKADQYFRRVQEHPENPPKIDWAFYKSKIGVPGLVDKFQKEYEAVKVPYPEDKYSAEIDTQEREVDAYIKQFIADSNKRIDENAAEIKRIQGLLKYGDMTMEDFKDAHPELALDPLNKPTIFPHTEEFQPGPEDEKQASHH